MTPFESARDEAADFELFDGYACLTGDCPHETQRECFTEIHKRGANFGRHYTLTQDPVVQGLIEALKRIHKRTLVDEPEGPELRAQNANNYKDANDALAAFAALVGEK